MLKSILKAVIGIIKFTFIQIFYTFHLKTTSFQYFNSFIITFFNIPVNTINISYATDITSSSILYTIKTLLKLLHLISQKYNEDTLSLQLRFPKYSKDIF